MMNECYFVAFALVCFTMLACKAVCRYSLTDFSMYIARMCRRLAVAIAGVVVVIIIIILNHVNLNELRDGAQSFVRCLSSANGVVCSFYTFRFSLAVLAR